jgi:hypothetical protein
MGDHVGTIVATAGFLLQFIVLLGTGIWKFAQVKTDLLAAIAASGKEIDERIDQQSRQFGETAAALRTKISEVEIYIRDHYVKKETFGPLMAEIKTDIKSFGEKIEGRLERMEGKIDNQPPRVQS